MSTFFYQSLNQWLKLAGYILMDEQDFHGRKAGVSKWISKGFWNVDCRV
jgi:hypothetical protein